MGTRRLDLNLEFEDEEEELAHQEEEARAKKAQEEAKDIDLHFAIEDEEESQVGEQTLGGYDQTEPTMTMMVADPTKQAGAERVQTEPSLRIINTPTQQPVGERSLANYRLGDGLKSLIEQNELVNAEMQAKLQEVETKAKTEIIIRASQDAKILEHRVVKLLTKVLAKAPTAKAELLMIKKLMVEHAAVQRLLGEVVESKPKTKPKAKKKAA